MSMQGSEASHRLIDQLQIPRRGSSSHYQPSRFKVWLSILKFDLAPIFGALEEKPSLQLQPHEDCDGMLRIWDGPLREPPSCKDVNW